MNILLVMFMAVVQASDLSKLMSEEQANPINEEKFQNFLTFVFRDTYCAEVFIDSSLSSNHLLKVLHKTQGVPSLILYPKKNNSCSDRIYIAINGNNLWPLIRDSPIQGVRFFILLFDSNEQLMLKALKLFQRGNMFFEHSLGYVVHLRHLHQVYKYNLIQKKFFPQNIEDITTVENEHVEDFGGKHIKVATFNCSVHSQVGPLNANGVPEYIGGVELEFFDFLATKLNFTYSIVVTKGEKKIGSIDKEGVWTKYGVIGLVGKKEVDVAFCGIWISSYFLSSALDVTESLNNVCIKFLVPRPGAVIKKGSGLIGPFGMYMWICIIISMVTVPCYSRTFSLLVSYLSKWKNSPLIKSYTNYGNALIRFWGIILSNSPRSLETLGPLRYIVCSWAVLSSFLGIFYCSSLRSNLLRINEGVSYDTVQSLVASDLFWSTIYKVDFNYLFNMDEDWHRKWAGRYKMHSIKKQCRLMKGKKIAVLASQYNEGVTTYESLPCLEYLNSYKTSMQCVNNLDTAIILQENSPYTKTFSKYIKKYQENGCFNRDYNRYFHLLSLKQHYVLEVLDPRARTNSSMFLGIYHLFFVFCLLLFGYMTASLVFLLEIIWQRRKSADDWHRKWAGRYQMSSMKKQCRLLKEKKVAVLASQYNEGVTTYESFPCLDYLNNYKISSQCVNNLDTAFILQNKSPYTKTFNKYIKRYQENGCFNRDYKMNFHLLSLKKQYVLEVLEKKSQAKKSMVLSMYNLFSSFCLLLIGNMAASLVFLVEVIWYRQKVAAKKSMVQLPFNCKSLN